MQRQPRNQNIFQKNSKFSPQSHNTTRESMPSQ